MTDEKITADVRNTVRFFWWCRQCGWWSEVDFAGLCSECRHDSDGKRRAATPEDVERLSSCRRCQS
jgi:hypothetical protein